MIYNPTYDVFKPLRNSSRIYSKRSFKQFCRTSTISIYEIKSFEYSLCRSNYRNSKTSIVGSKRLKVNYRSKNNFYYTNSVCETQELISEIIKDILE